VGEGESRIQRARSKEQSPCADPSSVIAKLCSGCCSEGIFGRKKKSTRSREEEKLDHCLRVGRLCRKCLGGGSWRERSHGAKRGSDCQGPTAAVPTEHSNACSAARKCMAACAVQWNHCLWRWWSISDKRGVVWLKEYARPLLEKAGVIRRQTASCKGHPQKVGSHTSDGDNSKVHKN
jgi:hypothetical protein